MTVKEQIVQQINQIDDISLLNEIAELLTKYNSEAFVTFSEAQYDKINESKEQIHGGDFVAHEDVMKLFKNG